MARILVNLLQSTGTKGGIEVYARELYGRLATMDTGHEFIGLASRELAEAGVPHTVEHVSGRDPVDEIVRRAGEGDVDLVVIGLRRRSPVGKLLMGSAAQRILLEVGCPVLAVKSAGEPAA